MQPEPLDDVQQSARQKMPKKEVYNCFIFMLYFLDLPQLCDLVEEHERLSIRTYTDFIDLEDDKLIDAAKQSDIILLSSGGGAFDIDGFLKEIDISDKIVVIVSAFGPETYRRWIKSRTDFHMQKVQLYNADLFTEFMNVVLEELDG